MTWDELNKDLREVESRNSLWQKFSRAPNSKVSGKPVTIEDNDIDTNLGRARVTDGGSSQLLDQYSGDEIL